MNQPTAIATFLLSLAIAGWLAWPSRNLHGNPDMEELLGCCRTTESVIARLYQGNGGATTSFWYSVTLEGDMLGKEKQIFFSYAAPQLQKLECVENTVLIKGEGFSRPIQVTDFQRLRDEPTQFWSGKQEPRSIQPSRLLAIGAAGTVAAAGVAVLFLAPVMHRRRVRNAA